MDLYTKTIYPDVENDYPAKLCAYIAGRFLPKKATSKAGFRFLDVGCSKGTHMRLLAKETNAAAYGTDLRADCEFGRVKACDLDRDKFPFKDNFFDFVWSKSVVEHVHNPSNMIRESLRVLKPGGIAIIMTPDWESQMSHFWDDYTHVQPWTRKSLMNCLKIHGYENITSELFYQLPYTWRFPWLKIVPKIIDTCTLQSWKWKDNTMTNGMDRKWIRFSKEKMLLATGTKPRGA